MNEDIEPLEDWAAYPEVEPCSVQARHEPHFFIPDFLDEGLPAPDFVCGGVPPKIIDIESAR